MEDLEIVHRPTGYEMSMRIAPFAVNHILIQTGEMQRISLNKEEVRQVINWLQNWLADEEEREREVLTKS